MGLVLVATSERHGDLGFGFMEEDFTEGLRGQGGEILTCLSEQFHPTILLPRFETEFAARRGKWPRIIDIVQVLQACVQ